MNLIGLITMAAEGLLRKKGRNALTTLGIVIAILSLTLVIAAGEGMNEFLESELRQEDNMRQVAVNPGFGTDIGNFFEDVTVEGTMSEEKRRRLKRAVMNRRRPYPRTGRKTKVLTDEALQDLASIPHVERVHPILLDRYDVIQGERKSQAVLSVGLSMASKRYEKRLIAGSFFSGTNAKEIIVHEHFLYTWKVYSDEDQAAWVGRDIVVRAHQGSGGLMDMLPTAPGVQAPPLDLERFLQGVELTDEERAVVQRIALKVMGSMMGRRKEEGEAREMRLKIVGIIRDYEPQDGSFNIMEDGNAMMADLFMPLEMARESFMSSAFNRDQGYTRAIVVAEDSDSAPGVQKEIQKKGFIAVSVGTILDQVDTVLTALTIFQSFMTGIIMLVAGLGIMTTMITSVVERTKEIGIWKAVGATNNQVLLVFLTESGIVGLVGSVLGLVIAWALMFPGNILGREIIEQEAHMPFAGDVLVMPLWVVLLAPVFATLIAVVAALYPALRGARIDPVMALRND